MVKSQNTAAIARATAREWHSWVQELDDAGAQTMKHPQIAELAEARMPADLDNAGWWAQGVAVAYEQEHGLRIPGQSSDGSFHASASKTYRGSRDEAMEAWLNLVADREEFNGVLVEEPASTSRTPKWLYWRVKLSDGTRVGLGITAKGEDRVTLGLEHTKLESPEEIDQWKPFWKALLAEL
ncbi:MULTISPECIES: hypothetical protein [Nesterenkonia]|uniref:Uncharacterized protein n=1 Tax=Nesterenkonia xinjiangensis TaxID=225327 RepID=A0A7Z0GIQ2_9MICC|nr:MULTISPECIES: hypothetical protein [Nesterenkonia]MDZ5079093.1 hypothetical protein [Nesterenkonia sp. HG001]NYJ76707.1 hypothetical protein [Nesterenkonia xinjiangensis]